MARPRKHLSQISPEAIAHNAARIDARLKAPKPVGDIGSPPRDFSKVAKKLWKELVASAPSQLGASDRPLMKIAVHLYAKLEDGSIVNSELNTLVSCLNKLGLIPQDRPAVDNTPKDDDPLDRFGQQ